MGPRVLGGEDTGARSERLHDHVNLPAMSHRFSRQELYDLTWSEPMKKLAPRFGISDVALAKACRRAEIPVPERGYWARLQAGKKVTQRPLTPRGLGMSDVVTIGENPYESHADLVARVLREPIPAPPSFPEDLANVRQRVRKMVGKVSSPHGSQKLHPLAARLLEDDERRQQAQQNSAYPLLADAPMFDSRAQRRRLRLLNAIFLGVQRCAAMPRIRDRQGRETSVEVGQQNVPFTLEPIAERRIPLRREPSTEHKRGRERLRLTIGSHESESRRKSWEDSADGQLEALLSEIVVELVVTGEANYRSGAEAAHEWWLRRRGELEQEERRRREEEERRERERLAKLEQERVAGVLREAENWRRAADLRAFVDAVRGKLGESGGTKGLEQWAAWVVELADRIDPIRAGRIPNAEMNERG